MKSYQWLSVVVLWLFILLHQSDNCYGDEENFPVATDKISTYRSTLEKSIQRAIGIGSFLSRPFTSDKMNRGSGAIANGFGNVLNKFRNQIHAIVPGTRWCGDGNIAANDDDTGIFRRTDNCCRQHDKCDFNIGSGESYSNLKNNGLFTRSACECDSAFYNCLKKARNPLAYDIGYTYFNILAPQCINYNYPIVSCSKRGGLRLIMKKCIEYMYDISQPMTYQWVDNPDF